MPRRKSTTRSRPSVKKPKAGRPRRTASGIGQLFRAVFDGSAIGIELIGPDRRIIRCNPAFTRMVGYSQAELRAMTLARFTHRDDVALDTELFAELLAGTRDSYQVDKRYIRKDGVVVWARLTMSAVGARRRGPGRIVAMVEDVTAQRLATDERNRLVHALKAMVREANALYSASRQVYDARADEREVLEQIAALLPAALQFDDVAEARIGHGDIVARTPGFPDARWSFSAMFRTRNGAEGAVTIAYRDSPQVDPGNPFLTEERRMIGTLGDMLAATLDRRAAERDLLASEDRLRRALRAAGMGVWEWEVGSGAMTWSDELLEIAGIARDAAANTMNAFLEVVHSDDRAAVETAIRRAVDTAREEGAFAVEFRVLRPDGGVRWVAGSGRVLLNERGAPDRMLGMAHDISRMRQLEQQYRQAQKMEAMGQLAGGVAHDFNNLVTVIAGYSELLLNELPHDSAVRGDIGEIAAAASRASGLTRQLLAFSRKQVLNPKVLNPGDVVAGMQQMLRRLIRATIELRLDLGSPGQVHVDPGQLEQVIMNLVVNARDSIDGAGTITIQTDVVDFDEAVTMTRLDLGPGRYCTISVSDTGAGMTAEVKARVFEPFFTTKAEGRGTGLGLATVLGIVQQSGGAVSVYGEPGMGAVFKVYLPWVDIAPETLDADAMADSVMGGETVLLVDDDPQVRAVAERGLRAHGYRVSSFAVPDDALEFVTSGGGRPDVLLTDVVMPGLQGPELAVRVREVVPGIRVLYTTGYTDRKIANEAGAQVLLKPFTPRTLALAVRRALDAAMRSP